MSQGPSAVQVVHAVNLLQTLVHVAAVMNYASTMETVVLIY